MSLITTTLQFPSQPVRVFPHLSSSTLVPLFNLPPGRRAVLHELEHRGEHMPPAGTTSIGVRASGHPPEWFKRITYVLRNNLPYVIGPPVPSHSDNNWPHQSRNTLAYSSQLPITTTRRPARRKCRHLQRTPNRYRRNIMPKVPVSSTQPGTELSHFGLRHRYQTRLQYVDEPRSWWAAASRAIDLCGQPLLNTRENIDWARKQSVIMLEQKQQQQQQQWRRAITPYYMTANRMVEMSEARAIKSC